MTTYQQHIQQLTKLQCCKSPRDDILMDITKEVKSWQEEGDHIIVLTDFNEVVTEPAVH